ncbi:MAG TPA: HAD family acid phosphatase [Candidatus Acidoferrales bacterium]|nr:HAD family acid phosphatase [Candidatus Acidoferrales bacterium]
MRFLFAFSFAVALLVPGLALADAPSFTVDRGIPNLDTVEQRIITYYDSGQYAADATTVTAHLQSYVDLRLKEGVRKPAVVFDIDDTALLSYPYERKTDFTYDPKTWREWENDDRFPPIRATLALARRLVHEHVAVFFVTGRRTVETALTKRELAAAGYPAPAGLYLRPPSDHAKSVIPFKSSARAAIASKGYTILASIGDQWSDLRGGHAERLYKLPNPMYFIP